MTQLETQFIKDNIINFESVKLGFTRNIPFPVLEQYEVIYKKYLDPQFSLTYWCGECVFDMLKRLIKFYEQNAQPDVQIVEVTAQPDVQTEVQTEVQETPKPKKTRKKK